MFGGIILGVVAVVVGFAARGRVKRGEANTGGIAIAGIVLGFLAIILGIVFLPVWDSYFNQVVDGCPQVGACSWACARDRASGTAIRGGVQSAVTSAMAVRVEDASTMPHRPCRVGASAPDSPCCPFRPFPFPRPQGLGWFVSPS